MSIDFDPDKVIAFSDNIMDELDLTIRPWIARIRTQMAGGDGEAEGVGDLRILGLGDTFGGYGGDAGIRQAIKVEQCLDWLTQLETGLAALSLASAVIVEKLRAGDELTAEELGLAASIASHRPQPTV